jgi:hypothetical protein
MPHRWSPAARGSRRAVVRRLLPVPLVLFLCLGCGAMKDSGRDLPTGRQADSSALARSWTAKGASLDLRAGGAFRATSLRGEYFSCSDATGDAGGGDAAAGDSGQVRTLSGAGTWTSGAESRATAVYLTFADGGCTATMWLGELTKQLVLWTDVKDSEELVTLK